jgi:hypothetical protein
VYDEGEQRALIEKLLEDVLNENVARLQADPGGHRSQPPGGNLVAYLNRYVLPLVEN